MAVPESADRRPARTTRPLVFRPVARYHRRRPLPATAQPRAPPVRPRQLGQWAVPVRLAVATQSPRKLRRTMGFVVDMVLHIAIAIATGLVLSPEFSPNILRTGNCQLLHPNLLVMLGLWLVASFVGLRRLPGRIPERRPPRTTGRTRPDRRRPTQLAPTATARATRTKESQSHVNRPLEVAQRSRPPAVRAELGGFDYLRSNSSRH